MRAWLIAALIPALAAPVIAQALGGEAPACDHSGTEVTLTIDGGSATLLVGSGGALLVSGAACDGATIDNTTAVTVRGGVGGETFGLDETERRLASTGGDRITVDVTLGAGEDALVVRRPGSNDALVVGDDAVTMTAGATRPHVVLDGATETIEIRAGGGNDSVSGAGSAITGSPYAGRLEVIGQDGGDDITGGSGADMLVGNAGGDRLLGETGDDHLAGGAGADDLDGGSGIDQLHGELGDDDLNGGVETDTCYQYVGAGDRLSCELPADRAPMPPSPDGELLVVNQNIQELHGWAPDHIFPRLKDLESTKELTNFAKQLPSWIPYTPDVIGLQESRGPSAKRIAVLLERVFKDPYRAVVRPRVASRIVRNSRGVSLHKTSTALIINRRTTKFIRGGYLKTAQRNVDRVNGKRIINYQAHALLEERSTGLRTAAMAIHFNADARFPSLRLGSRRRVEWSIRVAGFMKRNYPAPDMRILVGEFCTHRCRDVLWEEVRCAVTRMWWLLTREYGYDDAVFEANNSSDADIQEQQASTLGRAHRIDYVFAQADVVAASRYVKYNAEVRERDYISDHKGDFALLAPREAAIGGSSAGNP